MFLILNKQVATPWLGHCLGCLFCKQAATLWLFVLQSAFDKKAELRRCDLLVLATMPALGGLMVVLQYSE